MLLKTDYFHRLVTDRGRSLFFIARPRRFGKSLMIATFKAIFEGKRELFRGQKIDATDYSQGASLTFKGSEPWGGSAVRTSPYSIRVRSEGGLTIFVK